MKFRYVLRRDWVYDYLCDPRTTPVLWDEIEKLRQGSTENATPVKEEVS